MAAPGVSGLEGTVLGLPAASFRNASERRKDTAAIAMALVFLGIVSAGRRTVGVHSLAFNPLAASSGFFDSAHRGGSRLPGLQRWVWLPSGSRSRGSGSDSNLCGIPGL